jgi:hypothetical protein
MVSVHDAATIRRTIEIVGALTAFTIVPMKIRLIMRLVKNTKYAQNVGELGLSHGVLNAV